MANVTETDRAAAVELAARGVQAGPRPLRRLPEGWVERPYEHLGVRPLGPTIGAEIRGVDLAAGVSAAQLEDLRRALLEWKVLFFCGQVVTGEQHRAFARLWGELEVHPFLEAGDVPEIVRLAKDEASTGTENIWHSDVTWREIPAMGSVLRAIEVPEVGGDTLWADMGAAYDGLPDELKERIDGLEAVHDFTFSFGRQMEPAKLEAMREQFPPVVHPVVRTHPETGRRTLFVNGVFTSHIVGLEPAESEALLVRLCGEARVPEYQCRFRWRAHSIAFWDNRATQHYAVSDYWPATRVMERATIIGDRPR